MTALLLTVAVACGGQLVIPGADVPRTLNVDGIKRSYYFHFPKSYDETKRTPVVVALHGAGTNGKLMERFTGLTQCAEQHGFIVVYPNGTGVGDLLLTWNAGFFPAANGKRPDDIKYLNAVLDDLATVANVDKKRTYVCGLSNGGMMAFRAAAEMSHRFAAMADVAGAIVVDSWQPKNPMPVLHIHGTKDPLVPYQGGGKKGAEFLRFPSVDEAVLLCCKANGCEPTPK